MSNHDYALIMAGGYGTRLWPRSRKKKSKQLLNIIGENSLLQDTFYRVKQIVPPDRIIVSTSLIIIDELMKQIPQVPKENFIIETESRNTAPCTGIAAVLINSRDPDAIMGVFPADHVIRKVDIFAKHAITCYMFMEDFDGIVTLGVKPTRPETGYGYIHTERERKSYNGFTYAKVKEFTEKPNKETACHFFMASNYLWNSGMFFFKTRSLLEYFKRDLPTVYDELMKIEQRLVKENINDIIPEHLPKMKDISIDYGILEKERSIVTFEADFDWNDVGSWNSVFDIFVKDTSGNVAHGDHIFYETEHSYIYSEKRFVVAIGLKNTIIVDTDDAILVCKRDQAQKVSSVHELISKMNREDLL